MSRSYDQPLVSVLASSSFIPSLKNGKIGPTTATLHDRYETFAQVRKRCIEDFAKNDETRVAASFVSSLSWMSLLAGGEFMWNVDE